jgi:hypothetical protein
MPAPLDQLTTALADRYRIERVLRHGGMTAEGSAGTGRPCSEPKG